MIEIEAKKYNYTNFKKHNSGIIVNDNEIYYINGRQKYVAIKNILGITIGPLTYTWKKACVNKPFLCISFILLERTYDFILESIRDLKKFILSTRKLKQSDFNEDINNQLIKPLHTYKFRYINYIVQKCLEQNHDIDSDFFINKINKNWDFINNCEKKSNDIIINDNVINESFNSEGCYICLEEFKNGETGILFDCNHLYHKKCLLDYTNFSNKEINCVICNN